LNKTIKIIKVLTLNYLSFSYFCNLIYFVHYDWVRLMKLSLRLLGILLVASIFLSFATSCSKKETINQEEVKKMEKDFADFVKAYEAKIKPAYKDMSLAYFDASISSSDENWKKYAAFDMKLNEILSNKADFAKIEKIYKSDMLQDPLLKRHAYVLYLTFLSKHIDTAKLNLLSQMQSNIEQKYSNFRAEVGGKKLSDNEIEEILKTEKDSKKLQAAWEAHKNIGPVVAADIIALVKLRNEIAKELGFNNYHEMSLKLSDQDPVEIEKLFGELDNLTRDAFSKEKSKMDNILAKNYGITTAEMMPWNYQNRFFQEAPKVYKVDLDSYYKDKDIVETTVKFYKSLNLPIEDLVAKSDLFEKEKKNQHAYCINIDRDARDIRVLCNVKPTARWMETMMHEYGHALYEKFLNQELPWDLKSPAHIFTTEAIAMLFGRFATKPEWMMENIGMSKEEAAKISQDCANTLRLQQLVFSRWAQVMYNFEKSMYANPDQDLNKLWWDIVEKYQMIKRPAGRNMPDWATKIHIATSPCYYHNYLLGELLASQLYYTLSTKIIKGDVKTASFTNKTDIGKYLIDNIFKPGSKYYWNDMIEKATGEKLTPKYYAQQFVN
jgi:peptidyl-dipeptidase A